MKIDWIIILIRAHFNLLNAHPAGRLTANCLGSGMAQGYLRAVWLQNSQHGIQHFNCPWCVFFPVMIFTCTVKEGKEGHNLEFSWDLIWVSQIRIHNLHPCKCQEPTNFSQCMTLPVIRGNTGQATLSYTQERRQQCFWQSKTSTGPEADLRRD